MLLLFITIAWARTFMTVNQKQFGTHSYPKLSYFDSVSLRLHTVVNFTINYDISSCAITPSGNNLIYIRTVDFYKNYTSYLYKYDFKTKFLSKTWSTMSNLMIDQEDKLSGIDVIPYHYIMTQLINTTLTTQFVFDKVINPNRYAFYLRQLDTYVIQVSINFSDRKLILIKNWKITQIYDFDNLVYVAEYYDGMLYLITDGDDYKQRLYMFDLRDGKSKHLLSYNITSYYYANQLVDHILYSITRDQDSSSKFYLTETNLKTFTYETKLLPFSNAIYCMVYI